MECTPGLPETAAMVCATRPVAFRRFQLPTRRHCAGGPLVPPLQPLPPRNSGRFTRPVRCQGVQRGDSSGRICCPVTGRPVGSSGCSSSPSRGSANWPTSYAGRASATSTGSGTPPERASLTRAAAARPWATQSPWWPEREQMAGRSEATLSTWGLSPATVRRLSRSTLTLSSRHAHWADCASRLP
jgi:hypothetical protein